MVLGLLVHVTPSIFFSRILRSEALVYKSYFFQNSCSTQEGSINSAGFIINASVSYRYFKHPRPNLTKIGQNEVLFLTLPLVTLPFTLQHKQRNVRCYLKSLG